MNVITKDSFVTTTNIAKLISNIAKLKPVLEFVLSTKDDIVYT